MKHNFVLIPKEEIVGGGPMTIFVRCTNKDCIAGADLSMGDAEQFLEDIKAKSKGNCPFQLFSFMKKDSLEGI